MAEDDAARVAYLSRWRLRAILMGLAAIGVLLNGLAFQVPWNWLEQIVREFGSALIVAAVIGGTVDIFFKKEFARDAFVAAFRYVLPTELKEEVLRVISYKFLCTESRMIVQIEPISGTELVRPHLGVEKIIKNVTNHPEKIWVGMSLDDWGFPDHRSQVEKCSFDIGDGPIECEQIERDKHAVEKRTDDISIKPGQELKIVMKGVEIHRNDDSLRMFHAYAAKNPIVELRMPSDFYANCSFGVPDERITPSVLDHLYRLDGTQFPGQCTYIRWHKRGNVAQHPKS